MLKLTGPNHFPGNLMLMAKTNKLLSAPLKPSMKAGDKNCPNNILPANTLNRLTQAAVAKSNLYSTYSVTILAMPGFTPGKGEGTMDSMRCKPIANAASLAMR